MQILAWLCGLSLAAGLARQSRQTPSRYLNEDAMTELKDNSFGLLDQPSRKDPDHRS